MELRRNILKLGPKHTIGESYQISRVVFNVPADSGGTLVVVRSRLDEFPSGRRYLAVFAVVSDENLLLHHAERYLGNVVIGVLPHISLVPFDQFLPNTAMRFECNKLNRWTVEVHSFISLSDFVYEQLQEVKSLNILTYSCKAVSRRFAKHFSDLLSVSFTSVSNYVSLELSAVRLFDYQENCCHLCQS